MESEVMNTDANDEEKKHTDYIYMVTASTMIISLNAELDHHLADEMREVIDNVIDTRGVRDIVFDFGRISFMDSAGIGLIMGRYKKVREIGNIYVAAANQSIQRILLISGLHKIVKITTDVNSAVKEIKKGVSKA